MISVKFTRNPKTIDFAFDENRSFTERWLRSLPPRRGAERFGADDDEGKWEVPVFEADDFSQYFSSVVLLELVEGKVLCRVSGERANVVFGQQGTGKFFYQLFPRRCLNVANSVLAAVTGSGTCGLAGNLYWLGSDHIRFESIFVPVMHGEKQMALGHVCSSVFNHESG